MSQNESGNPDRVSNGVPSQAAPTRALVIGPYLVRHRATKLSGAVSQAPAVEQRTPAARLAEACKLAGAIDLDVADATIVPVNQIRPATFIGSGKVNELARRVEADDAGLVVLDCALSPVQQRNL